MKLLIILTIIVFSSLFTANAQSVSRYVLASNGSFLKNSTLSMDYTIGEAVADFVSTTSKDLSSGFQLEQRLIDLCNGNCYSLSGIVKAGTGLMLSGSVYLIDSTKKSCMSLLVNDGSFRFTQTFPSRYTFLAVPSGTDYQTYSPTYFVDKLTLESANFIKVSSSAKDLEIRLANSNSVKEIVSGAGFVVFPNPASDFISVSTKNDQIKESYIANALGQKMNCSYIDSDIHLFTLAIGHLSPGVYLLVYRTQSSVFAKSFVKK